MSALDLLTIGESLGLIVAKRTGRLANSPGVRLGFGGAESNVAIGMSRLGASTAWAGRVGADGIGDLITRELRAEGIEVHATVDPSAATALMIKERPSAATSRVTYYRSAQAGSRLNPDDIADGLVERARVLHVTGITAALGAQPLAAIGVAIDRARAAGAQVSFDVNHRPSLWRNADDAKTAYRALVARADIVFAGADESTLVTGVSCGPEEQAAALQDLGARCAVIKLGERGAYARDADRDEHREAMPVQVVDTVGAGDAFVAGWLSETVRGKSLKARLETAILCGALACTTEGDWEAAPTRADLARFVRPDREPVLR